MAQPVAVFNTTTGVTALPFVKAGHLTDGVGGPILQQAGVVVEVRNDVTGELLATTVTDANGNWSVLITGVIQVMRSGKVEAIVGPSRATTSRAATAATIATGTPRRTGKADPLGIGVPRRSSNEILQLIASGRRSARAEARALAAARRASGAAPTEYGQEHAQRASKTEAQGNAAPRRAAKADAVGTGAPRRSAKTDANAGATRQRASTTTSQVAATARRSAKQGDLAKGGSARRSSSTTGYSLTITPAFTSPTSGQTRTTPNVTFTGVATTGTVVDLYAGALLLGSATAAAGVWSIPVAGLSAGALTVDMKIGGTTQASLTFTLATAPTNPGLLSSVSATGPSLTLQLAQPATDPVGITAYYVMERADDNFPAWVDPAAAGWVNLAAPDTSWLPNTANDGSITGYTSTAPQNATTTRYFKVYVKNAAGGVAVQVTGGLSQAITMPGAGNVFEDHFSLATNVNYDNTKWDFVTATSGTMGTASAKHSGAGLIDLTGSGGTGSRNIYLRSIAAFPRVTGLTIEAQIAGKASDIYQNTLELGLINAADGTIAYRIGDYWANIGEDGDGYPMYERRVAVFSASPFGTLPAVSFVAEAPGGFAANSGSKLVVLFTAANTVTIKVGTTTLMSGVALPGLSGDLKVAIGRWGAQGTTLGSANDIIIFNA